jgi:alkylation response protein AidB-like acyl-CoA dehydrogenase
MTVAVRAPAAAAPTDEISERVTRCEAALAVLSTPGVSEPSAGPLIDAIRRESLLAACVPIEEGGAGLAHHPPEPGDLLHALIAIGRANLSAGRLFEGHVNAIKLVALYADQRDRRRLFETARDGALFGVWGADGRRKVRIGSSRTDVVRLSGEKRFASGADVIGVAIVTASDEEGRLVLIALPVQTLEGRLFPSEWSVSGMKATASGRCDLEGFESSRAIVLGRPGDYLKEPHFQGGVWRYAAVQLGGMYALTRAAADQLCARDHAHAPLQAMRLRQMISACETARLWLAEAAAAAEHPRAGPEAVQVAILARLKVAQEATGLIALVDEALGAASFATAHPAERVRRDLQFYMRQANPDGMGHEAVERILADPAQQRRWGIA